MKVYNYTSINTILDKLLRHPLLQGEITKEAVVSYLVEFINITQHYPEYQHREDEVDIHDYRGVLPCEVITVDMVKNLKNNICMKAMTDVFLPKGNKCNPEHNNTFKLQGNIIYTSFKEGKVLIAYTTIPVDNEGFPMLLDDSIFTKAFDLYVKSQVFGILFDLGKINQNVLQHTEQEYAWAVGQLKEHMTIPDVNEMESIKSYWTSILPSNYRFDHGFKNLVDENVLRNH